MATGKNEVGHGTQHDEQAGSSPSARPTTSTPSTASESPWRSTFEAVKAALAQARIGKDAHGTVGSINWLREAMKRRGGNPNVVRNILYRDKGKLEDKRILFQLLKDLWQRAGRGNLQVPELEVMLFSSSEQQGIQLLGREKRQAYKRFVSGVRNHHHPKMLVVGRPGSGKTLLTDYIQEALERPPRSAAKVVRLGIARSDIDASLLRLAQHLGMPTELMNARLLHVGASSAYAVQADAQAQVARALVTHVRQCGTPYVLLLHLSQLLEDVHHAEDSLAGVPLRLFRDDVPRVSANVWLWQSLILPLSTLPNLSVCVSMVEPPEGCVLGAFANYIRLSPPSLNEARSFVRATLPGLEPDAQEALVARAKHSFEDLRTLTLLQQIRQKSQQLSASEQAAHDADAVPASHSDAETSSRYIQQLSHLVSSVGNATLKQFLSALALLSLREYPSFSRAALLYVQHGDEDTPLRELHPLELAFLDAVPACQDMWRAFSPRLTQALRHELQQGNPSLYKSLSYRASQYYREAAHHQPQEEAGYRYVYYLLAAEAWQDLADWLSQHSAPQYLMQRLWQRVRDAGTLAPKTSPKAVSSTGTTQDAHPWLVLTFRIAAYYVRMGSYHHREAQEALATLAHAPLATLRSWTQLKLAEGHINLGQYSQAEQTLRAVAVSSDDDVQEDSRLAQSLAVALAQDLQPRLLHLEYTLVRAAIARWHSQLAEAARLIDEVAQDDLSALLREGHTAEQQRAWLQSQVQMWAGLIAKDRRQLTTALHAFATSAHALSPSEHGQWRNDHQVARARLAFQQGDVRMMLGRFDAAEQALNHALQLSEGQETPVHERLRYLLRYATLLRYQSKPAEAAQRLEHAHSILQHSQLPVLESQFEQAKLHFEQARLALSIGECSRAILLLHHHLQALSHYQQARHVDTSFRRLRAQLYLARAYWGRAQHPTGWRYPLLATSQPSRDLQHAWHGIRTVLDALKTRPHYGALYLPAYYTASVLHPDDQQGIAHAQQACDYSQDAPDYWKLQSWLFLATRQLRATESDTAAHSLAKAASYQHSHDDPRMMLWYQALKLHHALLCDAPTRALESLAAAQPLAQRNRACYALLIRQFADWIEANPETKAFDDLLNYFAMTPNMLSPQLTLFDNIMAQVKSPTEHCL